MTDNTPTPIAALAQYLKLALATCAQGGGADETQAREALDEAMREIAKARALTWSDARAKLEVAGWALAGRNAKAARRVIASALRDLENPPPPKQEE